MASLDQLNAINKHYQDSGIGRNVTQQELDFFESAKGSRSLLETAFNHVQSLNSARQTAKNLASGYGGQLSDQEAQQLIDQVWTPGDYNTFNNLSGVISPIIQQTVAKKEQEAFKNPQVGADQTGTAARLVEQTYGRPGTPEELDFFAKALAQGESPYELQQFLTTTPEYLQKQAGIESERVKTESAQARESLNQELLKSENQAFQQALPDILGQYMRAGRIGSSGVDAAVAKERAKLAESRQGFLANAGYEDAVRGQGYGREDFVNSRNQAFNQYLRQNEPQYQQRLGYAQQPFQDRAYRYGIIDQTRQRGYDLQDYDREKSDFDRYLQKSKNASREQALYGLGGSLLNTGLQGLTSYYGRR